MSYIDFRLEPVNSVNFTPQPTLHAVFD